MQRCFLCAQEDNGKAYPNIQSAKVAASKKPLQLVLQHLANCIKIKLVFHENAVVCPNCLSEFCNYDKLMLELLACQRNLTRKLEKIVCKTEASEEFIQISEHNTEEQVDVETVQIGKIEENVNVDSDEDLDDATEFNSDIDDSRQRVSHHCMACNLMFNSRAELTSHSLDVHAPKQFICKVCGVSRKDEEYLELHMNIHEGKTENECRYCPNRYSRPVNTIRHMRKHWDKKKFQCEKCGERFSQDNMLYNHRLRHEAEENPLICSICNQSFKSRKTFNHHMIIHQENRPRYHCTHCSKSFTERYTLKVHMRTHSINEIQPTTVEVVEEDIDFKETENSVKMILEQDVNEEQEYSCVICRTTFETKCLLNRHLQFDHDVILK